MAVALKSSLHIQKSKPFCRKAERFLRLLASAASTRRRHFSHETLPKPSDCTSPATFSAQSVAAGATLGVEDGFCFLLLFIIVYWLADLRNNYNFVEN